ncbi:MAG: hypothetical protein KZQ95_01920 [Candidatus Thiodiazotropha sp. (ex Epidulcina cf. delphinae)]|nr:hypothetical protein [Candidatus Thiodiazotropha sp. (ex Epidulcina cf. delphinae)]
MAGVEIHGLNDIEEIFEIILDSYGFPRDNTPTRSRKVEPGQPVFCRDYLLDVYIDAVQAGTNDEFQRVLDEWKDLSKDLSALYFSDDKHH